MAVTHEGLRELSFAMAEVVVRARRERVVERTERIVLRPKSRHDSDVFTVEAVQVEGAGGWRPEVWGGGWGSGRRCCWGMRGAVLAGFWGMPGM